MVAYRKRAVATAVMVVLGVSVPIAARSLVRDVDILELKPLWDQLDQARSYKSGFLTATNRHADTAEKYVDPALIPALGGRSAQQTFKDLVLGTPTEPGFGDLLTDHPVQAGAGLREALNAYLEGQLLVANQLYVWALRARFPLPPEIVPVPKSPLELLTEAEPVLEDALDLAIFVMESSPEVLRQHGTRNEDPDLGIVVTYVDNATYYRCDSTPAGIGELCKPSDPQACSSCAERSSAVDNEFKQLTGVLDLLAAVRNERALRLYRWAYAGDNQDPEGDLVEAAETYKASGQTSYLITALMASVQDRERYQENQTFAVNRRVVTAFNAFQNLKNGLQPVAPVQNFIPPVEVGATGKLAAAWSAVVQAETAENAITTLERELDRNETALTTALGDLRGGYLFRLETWTDLDTTAYDLTSKSGRAAFLEAARASVGDPSSDGDLHGLYLDIETALLELRQLEKQAAQIEPRIDEIVSTTRKITYVNAGIGGARAAYEMSKVINDAEEKWIVAGYPFSGTVAVTRPGNWVAAAEVFAYQLFETTERAIIADLETDLQVYELLQEAALLGQAMETQAKVIEARQADLNAGLAEVERLALSYAEARADISKAYYNNPAYRLQRDSAREQADDAFYLAMERTYYAAKALEYEWTEILTAAVDIDPLNPTSGSVSIYNPEGRIRNAESVFAIDSAGDCQWIEDGPTLRTFLTSLYDWDFRLRDHRDITPSTGIRELSLCKDILGYVKGVYGTAQAECDYPRFTAFIEAHRIPGSNPLEDDVLFDFAVPLALFKGAPTSPDFSARPNMKMQALRLRIDHQPDPRPVVYGSYSGQAMDSLIQWWGETQTRSFFAQYGDDDVVATRLDPKPATGQAAASKDVALYVADWTTPAETVQIPLLSPAVTNWRLKLDLGFHPWLIPENFGDITIEVWYSYGRPVPPVNFGSIPPPPS